MKTTLRDIKNTIATDITSHSTRDYNELRQLEVDGFKEIAYSVGVYGVNGLLIQGLTTGEYYKITRRSTALFIYL